MTDTVPPVSPVHAQLLTLLHRHLGSREVEASCSNGVAPTTPQADSPAPQERIRVAHDAETSIDTSSLTPDPSATARTISRPEAAPALASSESSLSVLSSKERTKPPSARRELSGSQHPNKASPPQRNSASTRNCVGGRTPLAGHNPNKPRQSPSTTSPSTSVDGSEAGEERLQGLLRMSRASGTGLRNALSRLETEREAGRKQLEASRARESRLKKDLAQREAAASAGQRQVSALRQALEIAQQERIEAANEGDEPTTQRTGTSNEDFESRDLESVAEALRRRRARTRAFRVWVRQAHASVLLLLSERLSVQSAVLRALKRWRRQFPPRPTPGRIFSLGVHLPTNGLYVASSMASSPGRRGVAFSEFHAFRLWHDKASGRRTMRSVVARVRLSQRRRALWQNFRSWRGVQTSSLRRRGALRQARSSAAVQWCCVVV